MKPKFFFFIILIVSLFIACNQSKKSNEKESEVKTEETPKPEELKPVVAKGVVLNAENGEPIGMAIVIVAGTRNGGMTSPDGKFQIQAPGGAKQLAFSAQGFEGKKVDIDAEKEMTVKLNPKTE